MIPDWSVRLGGGIIAGWAALMMLAQGWRDARAGRWVVSMLYAVCASGFLVIAYVLLREVLR